MTWFHTYTGIICRQCLLEEARHSLCCLAQCPLTSYRQGLSSNTCLVSLLNFSVFRFLFDSEHFILLQDIAPTCSTLYWIVTSLQVTFEKTNNSLKLIVSRSVWIFDSSSYIVVFSLLDTYYHWSLWISGNLFVQGFDSDQIQRRNWNKLDSSSVDPMLSVWNHGWCSRRLAWPRRRIHFRPIVSWAGNSTPGVFLFSLMISLMSLYAIKSHIARN